MRPVLLCLTLLLVNQVAPAQNTNDGPSNEKAQKTYREAQGYLKDRKPDFALDSFKKADKQDGGHCLGCQKQMIKYGEEFGDWKAAELAAQEMLAGAKGDRDTALAHYELAAVLMNEGLQKRKEEYFNRAHEECLKAIPTDAKSPMRFCSMAGRLRSFTKTALPRNASNNI